MAWSSIIAIYLLFWVLCAFMVMPFGLRTPHDAGEKVGEGHADSAPVNFRPLRIIMRTTVVAAFVFALFYANYVNGWVTVDMLERMIGGRKLDLPY
jgi:predicted secreted protein